MRSPVARGYLGVQAAAGALWWVAVAVSDDVQRWTLGEWDPAVVVGPDLVLFVGASAVAALLASPTVALVAALWTTGVAVALFAHGMADQTAGWGVVAMALATLGTWGATAVLRWGRLPLEWFFVGPFSFRVARERSGARHLRRSLSQLVVFWTTFFVVVPALLTAIERRLRLDWPFLRAGPWTWIGVVAFVAASGLGLWSCIAMALRGEGTPLPSETARKLVIVGPYRYVRNPMAVAGGIQTAAVGLVTGSWMVVAIAVAGAVAWNQLIRPDEEADLAARFGEPYERYRAAIRCWVPTIRTDPAVRG